MPAIRTQRTAFHSSQVFHQMLRSLLLWFCIISCILYGLAIFFNARKTYQEIQNAYAERLKEWDGAISEELSLIRNALLNIVAEESVVRCVMDPDMNDAQTLFSCMSALERQMRQVPHIMDLVLYPVDSGVACSAKTGVTDFSNYSESEMIRTYLDTRELVYQKDQMLWLSLEKLDGQYRFICEFFYSEDRPIGFLMATVSEEAFIGHMQGSLQEGERVEVLTSDGERLYSSAPSASSSERCSFREVPLFGIKIQYFYPFSAVFGPVGLTILRMLPLFLLILGVGILCTYGITVLLYAPLGVLVKKVQGNRRGQDGAAIQDEYRFIAEVLEENARHDAEMSTTLNMYIPQILESLCGQVLCSGNAQQMELWARLSQLAEWDVSMRFRMFVAVYYKASEEEMKIAEGELLLFSLRRKLGDTAFLCLLVPCSGQFVLLYQSGPEQDAKLLKVMEATARERGLCLEVSPVCGLDKLENLQMVYQDLSEELNRQLYDVKSNVQRPDQGRDAFRAEIDSKMRQYLKRQENEDPSIIIRELEKMADYLSLSVEPDKRAFDQAYFFSIIKEYLISRNLNIELLDKAEQELRDDFSSPHRRQLYFSRLRELLDKQSRKKASVTVERICEYVTEEYADANLSLRTVAEFLKMNQAYLSTLFAQKQGVGFVDYLNQYRVDKAKILLQSTDLLIKEVGFKVGFNSTQNFNRVFKKWEGITPLQYRQAVEEEREQT